MINLISVVLTFLLYSFPVIYLADYLLFSMRYKDASFTWHIIDFVGVVWLLSWVLLLLSLNGYIRIRI